jgi:hypothetical protein
MARSKFLIKVSYRMAFIFMVEYHDDCQDAMMQSMHSYTYTCIRSICCAANWHALGHYHVVPTL